MPIEAAPTVRESLVSAMDTVIPETPAPAADPVAEAPAPTEAAPAPAETPKADRPRDAEGKFTEKPKEQEKPKEAAAPAPAPRPKVPRPSSWKKELEPKWDAFDPEVQAYIRDREKQYQDGVSTYKTEADRSRAIRDAIAPFEPMLQQSQIPVDKWIQNLGRYHQILSSGTPQDKVQTVAQIIRGNGIDAQALFQVLTGQQPTYQPQALQQATQQQTLTAADVEKAVEQKLLAKEVEGKWSAFSNAVSEGKHPHYEEVKPTMAQLLDAGLADDYAGAYELALSLPKHKHLVEVAAAPQPQAAPEKLKEDPKQAAARARSQAVSVKSSTPSAMAPATDGKPKGLRDSLASNFDAVTNSGRV